MKQNKMLKTKQDDVLMVFTLGSYIVYVKTSKNESLVFLVCYQ